jgi:hypothetical protein
MVSVTRAYIYIVESLEIKLDEGRAESNLI